ncbi:MAG: peptidoglycan DD-metalloendopeptidase family protein [Candidatus Colwellbacteria bacterium]|nr:peptidoglycan DD-metalloendopeptidase family protein [Candidatus Colwellbacteria bacterium]
MMNRFFKKLPGLLAILFIAGVLTSLAYPGPVEVKAVAAPPALNGYQLSANQSKWVKYIAQEVVPFVGADVAARGTWWALKEGVLGSGNPIGYSNCGTGSGNTYIGFVETCPSGYAWQVGIAAVQVPNPSASEVISKAKSLHGGMSLKEIIAQVSISAGHPQGTPQYNTAVNSSGDLQKSLLLRDPATGFYFVNREVVNECINSWLSWCNGGWSPANQIATNQQVTKNVIAKLAAYYKEANSGAAPTPPPADYKQCVAAGSQDSAAGADPAATLTDEEQKEVPLGLSQQIGKFYSFALGIGALVALGVLIFGGILYTASAGNASRQDDAKQWITGSIVGLIILFGSWFILNTVNPELTKLTDLRLLVNKAAEDSSGLDGGSPPFGGSPSPYPVIDGQTCPMAPGFSYGSGCGSSRPGVAGGHQGVDLMAKLGSPLYAIEDGVVSGSWGWNTLGGWRFWLYADSGNKYYYAHTLSKEALPPLGKRFKAGDQIGYVGESGNGPEGTIGQVGGPHLHLQWYSVKGGPTCGAYPNVDPVPLIKTICSQ